MLKLGTLTATLGLATAMFVAAPAPSHAADTITLRLGTATTTKWSIGIAIRDVLATALDKHSNGRIKLEAHYGRSLCSEHSCVEQMRLGQIDIATVSSGNVGAFGTTFDIINLPYLFKDAKSASRILNGWLAKALSEKANADMGMQALAVIPVGGFRQLDNTVREVRVPADLKGIKIRVTKSPTEFNLIKAWGGVPVPYDWSALYEGLQTGVVQGMYLQDTFTSATKMYEVVKHITHVGGAWSAHPILMDQKRYEKLPAWAQEAVTKAAADLQRESFAIDAAWIGRATKGLDQKVKIYKPNDAEMQLWYKGARTAWAKMKGAYDPAMARRALEEQGQTALIKELESAGAL
jgi:TRAP-type transport system periplasmic protein